MKKIIVCLIAVMLLASSACGMASSIPQNNEPDTSLQLMYAKMQLEMAEIAKNQAMSRMEEISKLQEEQKKVAGFLSGAKQLRADAQSADKETEMPGDMADYMTDNGLSYDTTGGDLLMTHDEWDTAINSLEDRLDALGTEAQRQMIYVQELMGQYNSYLSGSNTQISNTSQTLSSLARGQSMYGDSEAGLAIAALVIGLVLGCAVTLGVQRMSRKPDKA